MLKTLRLTHCFFATKLFRVIRCDHAHQASCNSQNINNGNDSSEKYKYKHN